MTIEKRSRNNGKFIKYYIYILYILSLLSNITIFLKKNTKPLLTTAIYKI